MLFVHQFIPQMFTGHLLYSKHKTAENPFHCLVYILKGKISSKKYAQ